MKYKEDVWETKRCKDDKSILMDIYLYDQPEKIDVEDRRILREIAKRVNEIINDPMYVEKKDLWTENQSLVRTKPPIVVLPQQSWTELLPYSELKTSHPFLREYEWYLRSIIYRHDNIRDDYVFDPYVQVPLYYYNNSYGLPTKTLGTGNELDAARFVQQINEESDIKKIKPLKFSTDEARTNKVYDLINHLIGDIVDVRVISLSGYYVDAGLIWQFIVWRGLEQTCYDMIERPSWVHKVMDFLCESNLELLNELEKSNKLSLNTEYNIIFGSGGFAYTNDLPQPDFNEEHVRAKDMFGATNAQDFQAVSPQMLEEFVLPYQIKILEKFGLSYYGCCEDLTPKIDSIFKIPNLRMVSVSPWADLNVFAERLEDKYCFVWKPNPAFLAMETFDEQMIEKKLREGVKIARNNILQIDIKDINTVRNEPSRITRWVEIARKVVESY